MRWRTHSLRLFVAGLLALAVVIGPAFAALRRSQEPAPSASLVAHAGEGGGDIGHAASHDAMHGTHDPSAEGAVGADEVASSSCPGAECAGSCTALPTAEAPAIAMARAVFPAPQGPQGGPGLTLPPETPPPIA